MSSVDPTTIDLTGKVALVTGGSRGLGRSMSIGLAKSGASVIVASRKKENCDAVCEEIEKNGGKALAVGAHTGDTESLDALIDASVGAFGKVDIVVNNAGINPAMGTLTDLEPSMFDKLYQVNVRGPWYLASRLAPIMAENGGGIVVNVISVSGIKPPAYQGFYATTKAALNAMTRVMAAEWADMNIRVNSLAPGSYHSDLMDSSIAAIPGFKEGSESACLQKRIAETDEILGPLMYLVSDMSCYTTGTTLVADGGYLVL